MVNTKKQSQKSSDNLKQTQLTTFFNTSKNGNLQATKQIKPKQIKKKIQKVITISLLDSDSDDDSKTPNKSRTSYGKARSSLIKHYETKTPKHTLCVTKSTPLTKVKEKKVPRVLISKETKHDEKNISCESLIEEHLNKSNTESFVNLEACSQDVVNSISKSPSKRQLSPCSSKSSKKISPMRNRLSLKKKLFDDTKEKENLEPELATSLNKSNTSEETVINDFTNVDLEEYGIHMEEIEDLYENSTVVKPTIRVKSGLELFDKPNIMNVEDNALDLPSCSYSTKDIELEDVPKDSLKNLVKIMKFLKDYPNLYSLLYETDKVQLGKFFKMPHNHQFVCFRLFTRQSKWYNLIQFLELIKLDVDTADIDILFYELMESGFVLTDYTTEEPIDLLNNLQVDAIKSIFSSFKIKSKKKMKKDDYITAILTRCNTQTTLTSKRSDQILLDRISDKMGKCIKLENTFYNLLFRLHLLYSFTNPDLIKPSDLYMFMLDIEYRNKILPSYTIDYGKVFINSEEFERFSAAMEYSFEYYLAKEKKQDENMLKIAIAVCTKLEDVLKLNCSENDKPNYLKKFCAGRVFVNILSTACEDLPTHWEIVKVWLLLLLNQKQYCLSKRGKWFDHLALIIEKYEQNTEQAAQILFEALCDPRINIIDRNTISVRAIRLSKKKTNAASEDTVALLKDLIMAPPDVEPFPITITEASTKTSTDPGRKKFYIEETQCTQSFNLITVEQVALKYYATNGYPYGLHCEGSLMTSLFFLLFWDIIYEVYVPGTFVSEIQYIPLDLNSTDFYLNRKERIDVRLNEIEKNWSEEEYKSFFSNNKQKYSDIFSLVSTDIVESFSFNNGIDCISRNVLSQILKRLVINYRAHRAGMPDLFVWNPDTKKCKFVEVKGERDQLSMKQKLWLRYLLSVGADADVCHVNTIGSKIKKKM